jgi:hypothetical protein
MPSWLQGSSVTRERRGVGPDLAEVAAAVLQAGEPLRLVAYVQGHAREPRRVAPSAHDHARVLGPDAAGAQLDRAPSGRAERDHLVRNTRDLPPDWPLPGAPLSYTATDAPRSSRAWAVESPTMPAPTTPTSPAPLTVAR